MARTTITSMRPRYTSNMRPILRSIGESFLIYLGEGSIEGKPGIYTIYECVQHHHKHDETKPGKDLEVPLHEIIPKIAEPVHVDFLNK